MNLSNIDTKVSELTKTTVSEYPAANRLINANIWNQKTVTKILSVQDSSDFQDQNETGYSVLSMALVANQRDYNFGISNRVVEIKRVDVSYDGVKSNKSHPIDSSEFEIGLIEGETDVDGYFTKTAPAHDWKFNSVFLYPKPTESVGSVEVEVSRTARDFTTAEWAAGTLSPGFDFNFHPILAYGISYEYFIANKMFDEAAEMEKIITNYFADIRNQYGRKERNYPLRFGYDLPNYN